MQRELQSEENGLGANKMHSLLSFLSFSIIILFLLFNNTLSQKCILSLISHAWPLNTQDLVIECIDERQKSKNYIMLY